MHLSIHRVISSHCVTASFINLLTSAFAISPSHKLPEPVGHFVASEYSGPVVPSPALPKNEISSIRG